MEVKPCPPLQRTRGGVAASPSDPNSPLSHLCLISPLIPDPPLQPGVLHSLTLPNPPYCRGVSPALSTHSTSEPGAHRGTILNSPTRF